MVCFEEWRRLTTAVKQDIILAPAIATCEVRVGYTADDLIPPRRDCSGQRRLGLPE